MSVVLFEAVSAVIGVFVSLTLLKNYIFLMVSPFYPVKESLRIIKANSRSKKGGRYEPLVTIIVPAWNEEIGILKTVRSVLQNGYSKFELIVVNDGSTDKSDEIMKKFLLESKRENEALSKKIVYIYQENGGKGVALNTGIKKAHGEIILTIDADSALKKGAIKKLIRYYQDKKLMAVVGNVSVVNAETLVALAQKLEYYFGFYNKRGHAVLGAEYIFGGACASFRRCIFDGMGLFDEKNKTEDIEMSMRTQFYGHRCTYAEDVVCYTEGAADLVSLISQRVRWKKGRLDTFYKYRSMFFSTEDNHNFFLSFFILPFSLFTEVQLAFEPIAITILIIYSIITHEFLSLFMGILFIFIVYVVSALFSNDRPRLGIIILFPFTWPLFYFLDWIEFMALWKSIKMLRRGQDVVWQKWDRQGIDV